VTAAHWRSLLWFNHDYFPSLLLQLANATPANMQAIHIIANTLNGIYCDKSKVIVVPSCFVGAEAPVN